jgi:hypothetical protein
MVDRLPAHRPLATCAFCGQPFKMHDNRIDAWRSTSGILYCSEFCADDEEEARFQARMRA